jgi:hypothetical protein
MSNLCKGLPKEEREYLRRVLASWDDPNEGDRTYRRLWGMERQVFVIAADAVGPRVERLEPLIAACQNAWLTTRKGSKVLVLVGVEKRVNAELDRIFSQLAARRRRQARMQAAPGFFLPEHIAALWEIQSGRCYFSGELLGSSFESSEYQIDHLWPLASSMFRISFGTNWPTNLALVTRRINRMKGATSADEFISRVRRTKAVVLRPTKERRKIYELRHDRFRAFMVRECSAEENDWLG